MTEIARCRCGELGVPKQRVYDSGRIAYAVKCLDPLFFKCGHTPFYDTEAEAIAVWNAMMGVQPPNAVPADTQQRNRRPTAFDTGYAQFDIWNCRTKDGEFRYIYVGKDMSGRAVWQLISEETEAGYLEVYRKGRKSMKKELRALAKETHLGQNVGMFDTHNEDMAWNAALDSLLAKAKAVKP